MMDRCMSVLQSYDIVQADDWNSPLTNGSSHKFIHFGNNSIQCDTFTPKKGGADLHEKKFCCS